MSNDNEPANPHRESPSKSNKINGKGKTSVSTRPASSIPPVIPDPNKIEYFKDIVATIREPLLVLDTDLRVLAANRSFYRFFKVRVGETVGKLVYDLGNRQWDIPVLRALLETILPQKAVFNNYEVEHEFPSIGRHTLLLNARRIPGPPKEPQWILLAFEDVSARMRLERTLKASEERFRRAFETAQDGTLLIDKTSGQIVNSNQAAQELLGYSDQEFLKKKPWEIGILKNQRQFKQTTLRLEEQSVGEFYHTTIQTRLGGHFPADVYLMGKAAVIQCNIRDITEKKRIIDALKENEKKYHDLVNQSRDGIFLVDLSGKILTTNKAMCRELGYSEEEFLTMNIWDIIPEQYLEQHRKRLKKILQGKSLEEAAEYAVRGRDGKLHYVEVFSAPHYSGKDITGFQGIARDITARLRVEEGLRISEEKYRTLVNEVNDGFYISDEAGVFTFANPALARIYGVESPEALVGRKFSDFLSPEMPAGIREAYSSAMQTGSAPAIIKGQILRADGTHAFIEVKPTMIVKNRKIVGTRGVVRDITDRKQAEESLQRSQQETARVNSLLVALGQAAQYVQRAMTTEEVYRAIQDQVSDLGLHATGFELEPEGKRLRIAFISYRRDLVHKAENATGLSLHTFHFNPRANTIFHRTIFKRETIYIKDTAQAVADALPRRLRALSRPVAYLLRLGPSIYAPLNVGEETIGVLSLTGTGLSEEDIPAVTTFANQAAIAMQNTRLYTQAQQEISERKRTEQALRESEEKYRGLVTEISDGIFITNDRGVLTFVNPALARIHGFEYPDQLMGRTFQEFIAPRMLNEAGEYFKQVVEGVPPPEALITELVRPDGTHAVVEVIASIEMDGDKIVGTHGVVRDITERKKAEDTLRKSEKRFKALVENSLEEISLVAADGSLTWESPTRRRPLGYPPNSFVGHSLLDISHPDEREAITRLLGHILEEPGNIQEGIFRLRHQDGSWRWMEAVITNLLDEPAVRSIVINYRDITERKMKEEEIQFRTEELTALYQLSRALTDAKDLENVMALVNRHAVESVHTTFACIALVEDKELVPRAVYPIRYMEHDLILGHRQTITALPLCQQVLDKNEPVILQASNSEISNVESDILMLDFVQSVCLVPLHVGDQSEHLNQTIGMLILGEARQEKREPFTTEKIRLARSIGDQTAAAIRRLVLREQAGRRLQQLASLSEIDRTIASNFDLRISLHVLLKHVIEQLNVDAADVLVLNNHTKALEYASGSGFRSKGIEGSRQPMDEGQAGRALLERQIVKIPNVAASGADFAHPELLKAENIAAYFSVPLITKGQVVGVLEVCHRTPLDPNEEWLDFLRTLAGQAAIAIDNVHMFENLQRSTDELELAYDATIEGWSHALDLRDKETEGHTQRVTEVTVELARSFGLSDPALVQIRWGALLHDIGKMGVPDSILLKPSTLTEDEWVVMRKHPSLAHEMLLPIRYLHGALDIPYCHHEWWDGTGYPRGLKGEEIPLAARIFAVVDVWDALISDRPYRPAWSVEKARRHIETGSGTHFDPQVVIKFLLGHS